MFLGLLQVEPLPLAPLGRPGLARAFQELSEAHAGGRLARGHADRPQRPPGPRALRRRSAKMPPKNVFL